MKDFPIMTETAKGWVVATAEHAFTGRPILVSSTFAHTRKKSIELFVEGSGETWEYWRRKFNYRCVKAESTISINLKP